MFYNFIWSDPDPDPDPQHWLLAYFIFGTLNTVLFGQVPPKPSQNHHLNDISLLMDGSVSGFLKSGSAKKPGSIQIRNTEIFVVWLSFESFLYYYYLYGTFVLGEAAGVSALLP